MKRLFNLVVAVVFLSLPCSVFAVEQVKSPEPVNVPEAVKAPEANKAPLQLQITPPAELASSRGAESLKNTSSARFGYADMAKISMESSLGKASQAQAKAKQEKLQSQMKLRRKQLDKQKAAIEATISSLTPDKREAKAKEFQKKVEAFQKFGMNAEKELQTFQEGLNKSLYEAIQQAATEYGKANKLALVVVKREMLYLADDVGSQDATEGILKIMNEKWLKK